MPKRNLYFKAELMLREYVGLHKLHNSHERLEILRLLVEHTGKFTANEVVQWVKPHFISRATVYNTLDILEKAHVVHCLHAQHSGRVMEYELALGEQCAIQIVCTKCGRVSSVKDKSTDIAIKIKNYPNFIMQHYSVYVFGECKTCSKIIKHKH